MAKHRVAAVVLVVALTIGAFTQPAAALHNGEIADCGSAGTFTIRATPTRSAVQPEAPGPDSVLIFEEGGTLTVFRFVVNGQVIFDRNENARAANDIDEITCTITFELGVFEFTGILTP